MNDLADAGKLQAEMAEFFASYAAAWSVFDTEAVAAFIAVPFMQVGGTTTEFFETGAEVDAMLAAEAERWQAAGVTGAAARLLQVLALPDDAARVDVEWALRGGAGEQRFTVRYTLASEAGRWAMMAADSSAPVH